MNATIVVPSALSTHTRTEFLKLIGLFIPPLLGSGGKAQSGGGAGGGPLTRVGMLLLFTIILFLESSFNRWRDGDISAAGAGKMEF